LIYKTKSSNLSIGTCLLEPNIAKPLIESGVRKIPTPDPLLLLHLLMLVAKGTKSSNT